MEDQTDINQLILRAEEKLAALNVERARVIEHLSDLRRQKAQMTRLPLQQKLFASVATATDQSSEEEKITLFRKLFRGCKDIYPRRFVSAKTGRSGYQPACQNEWVQGICKKPKIKCNACDHQSYLPMTNQVVRNHLAGIASEAISPKDFVIGVYPLLLDETCWFLAADFDKSTWQEDVTGL